MSGCETRDAQPLVRTLALRTAAFGVATHYLRVSFWTSYMEAEPI